MTRILNLLFILTLIGCATQNNEETTPVSTIDTSPEAQPQITQEPEAQPQITQEVLAELAETTQLDEIQLIIKQIRDATFSANQEIVESYAVLYPLLTSLENLHLFLLDVKNKSFAQEVKRQQWRSTNAYINQIIETRSELLSLKFTFEKFITENKNIQYDNCILIQEYIDNARDYLNSILLWCELGRHWDKPTTPIYE